ncbi:SusC/RagA family TonB-linked outer membrane protein [Fulvivirgaceae bacterium BMA12]|uniref:SusC/RagA family TonB-linked outer membrane protein n=1 Tax=Agaribacillus aureus TaxID=3051825 RepID=A0ABT8LIK6_9BACT|nr:SusC/RagA family TonB-linked outer membrane protein [Fulvivirgaceae bacterium BMA12]
MKNILLKLIMFTKYSTYGVFLQLMFVTMVLASESTAQRYQSVKNVNVSLAFENAQLPEVIRAIEQNTYFEFAYDQNVLNTQVRLNFNNSDRPVFDYLMEMSKKANLKFKQVNNLITINRKKMLSFGSDVEIEIRQDFAVSGKVTDENDVPLPGVSIIAKGTTKGTVTDIDGNYRINVQEGITTLVYSYIGYLSQEIDISGRNVIDVVLKPDLTQLEEVVVTAMGVTRDRKSLGYAISKIDGKDLVKAGNPVNPFSILQGRAAGVNVRQSVSGPTGGIEINIRGTNALEFEANTRPLFVVDGVPIYDTESQIFGGGGTAERKGDYGSGINDLNALDIESLEILKGAKASVLYGSAGANGVVLITTKSGKKQEGFGVDVNYQYSIERPRNYIDFQNEFGTGWNEYDEYYIDVDGVSTRVQGAVAGNFGPAFAGNEDVQLLYWDGVTRPYQAYPNNYMFAYDNGHTMSTNVAISNGGDFGNTRFSFTNYDYQGIVPDFFQKKNTFSFAGKQNISPKVSFDYAANYYSVKTQNRISEWAVGMVNGLNRDAPYEELMAKEQYKVTDPLDPNFGYFYTDDYRDFNDPNYVDGILTQFYPEMPMARQYYGRESDRYIDDKSHLIASLRPSIYFTDWLYFVGQASIDLTNIDIENREKPLAVDPEILGGEYRVQKEKALNHEFRAFMNFDKSLVNDRLKVFVMGGGTYSRQFRDKLYAGIWASPGNSGFTYPDWYNLGNQVVDIDANVWPDRASEIGQVRGYTTDERKLYSVLGLATLTWDDIYTLELNARQDWTSTLDPENNTYFYPGVAFTWNFTNMARNVVPALQFGKLRASFADVGRDAPSTYFAYQGLQAGTLVAGTNALPVQGPSSLFGGVIKPERKREFEIGTELKFFQGNRLGIDFSYYNNNVYDQIMSVQLTPTTAANAIKINAGDVQNWGYELSLNGVPIQTNDLRLEMTLMMASQHNKIIELFPGLPQKVITNVGHGVQVLAREGERSGNIYAIGPRTVESGQFAGRPIVASDGISYDLDEQEEILTGNIYPDFLGGFSTNLSYKGLNLGLFLDYSFGASVYNFADYVLKGTGTSAQSLPGRNEEHGGVAYYIDDATGDNIPWEHDQPAPPNAQDGLVYHDGIIIEGVQEDLTDVNNPVYTENDVIVSAGEYYYSNFVYWTGGQILDGVNNRYDNDYIKIREITLSYNVPQTLAQKLSLQHLSVTLFARNLGYLYKTMPNFDAEASTGTKTFRGETVLPSTQSFGFQLSFGI